MDEERHRVEGAVVRPADPESIRGAVPVRRERRRAEAKAGDRRVDDGDVRRLAWREVGGRRRAGGRPGLVAELLDRAPGAERPAQAPPRVAVRGDRPAGDLEEIAGPQLADLRRARVGGGTASEPVDPDPDEAADGDRRRGRVGRRDVPGRDVAVAVPRSDAEGIAVAARGREAVGRRRRPGQPVGPRPAVARHLDVVRDDAGLIGARPGHPDALDPGDGLERPDTRPRRRRVVEELRSEGRVELGPGPVVAEGPDPDAAQAAPVDEIVLRLERRDVVDVQLAPGGDAAIGRRAVLAAVGRPGDILGRVVAPAMLGEILDRRRVDHGARVAVLLPGLRRRVERVGRRRPGPAVVRDAEDELVAGDPGEVGVERVDDVVAGVAERRDRPGPRRTGGPVVVAHDEDRVGPARGGRRLDRVVADPAGRVEGQLVAGCDRVQTGPDLADERGELVGVARHDRLEVEVDPVGATVADGRDRLPGEVGARRRAAEERRLVRLLEVGPGEGLDGQDHPGPVAVGGVDDRGQPRARPAPPAGADRAVRVALDEVAVAVGPDAEVGDRREDVVVERCRGVGDLPVRQEAEDLLAEAGSRVGRRRRGGRRRPAARLGVDDRSRVDDRRVDRGVERAGDRRPGLALRGRSHLVSGGAAGRERPWPAAADAGPVAGPRPERDGHPATRLERDGVVGVAEPVLVVDTRQGAAGRRRELRRGCRSLTRIGADGLRRRGGDGGAEHGEEGGRGHRADDGRAAGRRAVGDDQGGLAGSVDDASGADRRSRTAGQVREPIVAARIASRHPPMVLWPCGTVGSGAVRGGRGATRRAAIGS